MRRESFETLRRDGDKLILLDQRKLPSTMEYVEARCTEDVYHAIKDMIARGAPLIGSTAAFGVCFAAKESKNTDEFLSKCDFLSSARPTAVNLMWAIERMKRKALDSNFDQDELFKEAERIKEEDIEANIALSRYGATLLKEGSVVLTHCNAGALATSGWGTALGVIKEAYLEKKISHVYADETRPRLQGARLTAFELVDFGIPSTLIPDSAAATLIRDGKIDAIIVGADRIAINGDTANKLGTFPLSVIAKTYRVPMYIAAPVSTIDFNTSDGKGIPIEERAKSEVIDPLDNGMLIAPDEIDVFNPSFDVTPHENITAIITEKGIIWPPFKENIKALKS